MDQESAKPNDIIRKSQARLAAVKALYSKTINEDLKQVADLTAQMARIYDEQTIEDTTIKIDEKFLSTLLAGVMANSKELDQHIKPYLSEDWTLERVGPIICAILRCAVYEITCLHNISYKTIIDEYVNITNVFFSDKEIGFVNGILDKIAKEVREDG